MVLASGVRLGPCEIGARLGVGGMGEVYQATDTSLKRQVAIKVLPEAVAQDAERLGRFQPRRSPRRSKRRTTRGSCIAI